LQRIRLPFPSFYLGGCLSALRGSYRRHSYSLVRHSIGVCSSQSGSELNTSLASRNTSSYLLTPNFSFDQVTASLANAILQHLVKLWTRFYADPELPILLIEVAMHSIIDSLSASYDPFLGDRCSLQQSRSGSPPSLGASTSCFVYYESARVCIGALRCFDWDVDTYRYRIKPSSKRNILGSLPTDPRLVAQDG